MGWAWRTGRAYAVEGLRIAGRRPGLLAALTLAYALPALVSAAMVLLGWTTAAWQQVAVAALPWITLSVAPVVVMVAVAALAEGRPIGLRAVTLGGLRRLIPYLLTNLHTSVVFWVPVWLTIQLAERVTLPGAVEAALIGAVAVHQHVRTTLAPYGAVHGEIHPTRATLIAWRLGGRHFGPICVILGLGSAPAGAPLLLAYWGVVELGPPALAAALESVSGQLLGVLLQLIRPTLIPALHRYYTDVWPVTAAEAAPTRLQGVTRREPAA